MDKYACCVAKSLPEFERQSKSISENSTFAVMSLRVLLNKGRGSNLDSTRHQGPSG